MPRIIVDDHYCKGCGLCVDACPRGIIELYHPARIKEGEQGRCTGCGTCYLVCPDVAITVVR